MDIVLEPVQSWKSPCTFFDGNFQSRDHDVMFKKCLLAKPIKFGLNGKRILCWLIFVIEHIADFCQFMGYWPAKNVSLDHCMNDEFVSPAKPIVLCTIRKRISCWWILALKPIANFYPFLDIELERMGHVIKM